MAGKRIYRSSPTLRQIAERARVSLPTVSHVLGSRAGLYREETCLRVTKAAEALGYRPNAAAKAVVSGRFNCLAMVASVQSDRSYLPDALLNGVYAAAEAAGYHLMLSKLPDEKLTSEGFVPKILRELMVDGLLIDYINQVPTRMMELIHQYVIPSVLINSKQQTDCVYPADFDAGRRATARLLELGHRKITYVDYSASGHYSAFDRCHGYVAAMKDAGLTPQPLRSERVQSARESLVRSMQILEAADRPTAVVACGQEHAIAMLRAAERKQIRVPQDLSLLTFGDALTDDPCLSITTLQIPEYDIGKLATNMLLRKISGGNAVQSPMVVPFEWAHGESCARVN